MCQLCLRVGQKPPPLTISKRVQISPECARFITTTGRVMGGVTGGETQDQEPPGASAV